MCNTDAFSQQERSSTLQQTLFANNMENPMLWDGKTSLPSQDKQNDDNELVKYMSKLPAFLHHMEKQSNIQEKALNFGVLDWRRLEKWKYNERMPSRKYPQKASSSSKTRICQVPRKQLVSSHVRENISLNSRNRAVLHGSQFGLPKEENNVSYHHKGGEKYAELVRSNKGKETKCNQEYGIGRLQDHFHERAKSYEDQKKEMMSKEENSRNNSYALGNREILRLTPKCQLELENIVLFKPDHFKRGSFKSSQFTEPRISLDGEFAEMVRPRLSDFFCPQELKSSDVSVSNVRDPNSPLTFESIDVSESKHSLVHDENGIPSSFLESSDKNKAEFAENRRFSFHRGKTSKSLSFKDNSEVPHLSSVRPKTSSGANNFKNDPANGCSRARSSPLRRLLDPLLKHKEAHTAETVATGPSQPERPTTLQALLQLTLKNGLPFFKLVVNSSNDMLAATVKRLPASGKIDSCLIYTFYSVQEMKKKGTSWMNQGSKSKSSNLGYKIVGQMKISGSGEKCNVRECVLYGVDDREEQEVENEPKKELVAVIVRKPSKMELKENKNDDRGIVVILPGGVHGLPIKGTFSSLISRWRFGGSCDCGGWDVGCKLCVLVDCKKRSHSIDHVNLYVEDGEKGDELVFTMKPFENGYYSIELDASISLLEAFATCVAKITCLKFPEITDSKDPSQEYFAEAITWSRTLSPAGRI
ncbi:Protein of unknown function (DUF3527 [Striga hermonthica]|uniref:Uncharacterized protein n=1 Tax=Striga hermonthica TaxID=68872 RepID=A0A9N7NK24_STRHE|nr:Protein of unknown function (DUF3527 [Striga hermonthica]